MEGLNRLQDTWIKIWTIYMTWFTWHFGIHIGALGFALSNDTLKKSIVPIAIFMIALNFISMGAAINMRAYDISAKKRAAELGHDDEQSPIFGSIITDYARGATIASNALTLAAWIAALGVR